MKKVEAYKLTKEEAAEKLQEVLVDARITLQDRGFYYMAKSDTQYLDGGQVDERLSQALGLSDTYEHFKGSNGEIYLVNASED